MSFPITNRHRGVRMQAVRASWAIEDIRLLRTLALQGVPVDAIAAALGRTPSAIKNKAGMHGISLRGEEKSTERPCAVLSGAGQNFARNPAK